MVHKIENKNAEIGLERRRLLCKLLDIPPILLGLGTLEQLHDFFRENEVTKSVNVNTDNKHIVGLDFYKNLFNQYDKQYVFNQYDTQISRSIILDEIGVIINRLGENSKSNSSKAEKKQILYLQWEYHCLAARISADDRLNWLQSRHHLNSALSIAAKELHDCNLYATTQAHASAIELSQNNVYLARPHIDAALSELKNASPIVRCDVYALASRVYYISAQTSGDVLSAKDFLERSQTLSRDGHMHYDGRYIPHRLDAMRYHRTQFDSLFAMGRISDAEDILNQLDNHNNRKKLHWLTINMRRAQCYLKTGYPEQAIVLLEEALSYKEIGKEYIELISNMLQQIKNSKYGNSRDVQELELAIRNYHIVKEE
jgi:tetratricopeptide (TPR) repeat protein